MAAPVFDVLDKEKPKEQLSIKVKDTRDPVNTTCIQKMMEGAPKGKRHMVALRLASHLRWNFTEDIVRLIMENWRRQVESHKTLNESQINEEELNAIT